MSWNKLVSGAMVASLALVLSACTDDEPVDTPSSAPPASAAESPESPSPTVEAVEGVSGEREYYGVPLQVTVGPVQSTGDLAAVPMEVVVDPSADPTLVAEAPQLGLTLAGADIRAGASAAGASGLRLVDGASVLPVGVSADSSFTATRGVLPLDATTPVTAVSVHAAPEGETVDVLLPRLGMFRDVPVVDAGAEFDATLAEVGEPVEPPRYELRSFSATVDDVASTSEEGDVVTVTLTSDVLFDSSEHRLDAAAKDAVADVVSQIEEAAGSGQVSVVGHTDDVDTNASNQKLSEQRADAVAAELRSGLGGGYEVSSEGRGESEPVAAGTSSQARAANRRVEIVFTAEQEEPAAQDDGEGDLPAADVPESTGGDPVAFEGATPGQEFEIEAVEMVRTDEGIVGSLRLTQLSGPEVVAGVLGGDTYSGFAAKRGFADSNQLAGLHEVALLTGDERVFALDYEVPEGTPLSISSRRLLGEELIDFPLPAEGGILVTGVWPDTGQDTVTLEATKRFRLADVPVSDS
ncbi:OmpA family protein [Isoptericola jiangsuensis]|uniref:OmpA family protein n=1 Tax=Isoptericola jiangsuensis TaxID=548579 RepID=UPI003AADA83D